MMTIGVKMDASDNVAVVMQSVAAGESVSIGNGQSVIALDDIGRGHKIAVVPIKESDVIVKYGVPIGKAARDIAPGEHVHTHNVLDITREVNAYRPVSWRKR